MNDTVQDPYSSESKETELDSQHDTANSYSPSTAVQRTPLPRCDRRQRARTRGYSSAERPEMGVTETRYLSPKKDMAVPYKVKSQAPILDVDDWIASHPATLTPGEWRDKLNNTENEAISSLRPVANRRPRRRRTSNNEQQQQQQQALSWSPRTPGRASVQRLEQGFVLPSPVSRGIPEYTESHDRHVNHRRATQALLMGKGASPRRIAPK